MLAVPACAGMIAGLFLAGRDVLANEYLAQGLWRTSLRETGEGAMVGALAGVGAGLYMAAWLARRGRPSSEGAVGPRLGLLLALSLAPALAVMLLPADAPDVLIVPSLWVFGGGVLVLWAVMAAFLLSRASDPARVVEVPEGVWTMVVWLGYVAGLAQIWARWPLGVWMAGLVCGGLLAVVALYSALRRPVLLLSTAVGRRLQGEAASRRVQAAACALLAGGAVWWLTGNALMWQARASVSGAHPNLLIIAVDTLREDRVSLLSKPASGWDLTPQLRAGFAGRGTYFRRAYAQAPWTLPSFASIFTGLYPEEHGAQAGTGGLAHARLTLAEVLRERGYRTMAVISGEYLTSGVGMMQGFDVRDESHARGPEDISSKAVTDRALQLLASNRGEPFFLFLHYFDPHWIYQEHGLGFAKGRPSWLVTSRVLKIESAGALQEEEVADLKARYAEEIAYTDQQIGRVLAALEARGLRDATCVVFVADHGEEFGEHGGFEHGDTLYDELIHVPLLVVDPARPARAVSDDAVETRWLFGTVLQILGLPLPASSARAPSLLSPPPGAQDYARSSLLHVGSALVGREYKLIKRGEPAASGRGASMNGRSARPAAREWDLLFDLRRDPGETKSLSRLQPEVARRLGSTLDEMEKGIRTRASRAPTPELNRDQLRRLRDLGYL